MSNYTYLYNRLLSIKICFCCFLDIDLYYNKLSTIATISLLIKSQILPACFSCSSNFIQLHNSSESDAENIVELPEAIKAGDLSKVISVRSRVVLLPRPLISKSKCIFLQNHTIFLSLLN